MTERAINYDRTRWAKTIPWLEPRQLVVDNWGTMALDGRAPDNAEPDWAWVPSPKDAPPDVIRAPDYATGFTYMEPGPPLIHLVPLPDCSEPKVHHRALYPYRFGYVRIMACFAPEINAWCIGRVDEDS